MKSSILQTYCRSGPTRLIDNGQPLETVEPGPDRRQRSLVHSSSPPHPHPTMSSSTLNISPSRFAAALSSLPLSDLHAKSAELRNGIAHLKDSNAQMLPFAEAGDADCKEAMFENLAVIGRMNERVGLVKDEVERRGMPFAHAAGEEEKAGGAVNGEQAPRANGRATDEELRARVLGCGDADEGDADGAVHI